MWGKERRKGKGVPESVCVHLGHEGSGETDGLERQKRMRI